MLANALRLEVARHGVTVGSAHMSWIDTALVRDTQTDLSAFNQLLASFPWPMNKTTTVDKCASAFVKGIQRRRTRVYCPGWVALLRWVKPVLSTPVGEMPLHKSTAELLPQLDAQVAALGRSTSAYNRDLGAS
jgi:short-subunit dehydrogenase